jgi:hypothetical protein
MLSLDGLWWLWWLWWLCVGGNTYSPSQLGDYQFQSLRIPTAIGASLCIAVVCCCLLRIPTAIGMWLINIFSLSVCGLDGSVALTCSEQGQWRRVACFAGIHGSSPQYLASCQ